MDTAKDNVALFQLPVMLNYGDFFWVGKGCPEGNQILDALKISSKNISLPPLNTEVPKASFLD